MDAERSWRRNNPEFVFLPYLLDQAHFTLCTPEIACPARTILSIKLASLNLTSSYQGIHIWWEERHKPIKD